jgi:hypothetical protein
MLQRGRFFPFPLYDPLFPQLAEPIKDGILTISDVTFDGNIGLVSFSKEKLKEKNP